MITPFNHAGSLGLSRTMKPTSSMPIPKYPCQASSACPAVATAEPAGEGVSSPVAVVNATA